MLFPGTTRHLVLYIGLALLVFLTLGLGARYWMAERIAARCETWLGTGRAELANGDALFALDQLGRALREPSCEAVDDARAWFDYAEARIRVPAPELGHLVGAVKALRTAQRIDPRDEEIAVAIAEAYLGAGLHAEALSAAQRVLAMRPEELRARRVAAGALLAAGRARELRALLDEDGWLRDGFWFRATRLLLEPMAERQQPGLLTRLLEAEPDVHGRVLLRLLASPAAPDGGLESLVADLASAPASPDLVGTALLLLEERGRPELALRLLEARLPLAPGAARKRLVLLAAQDGRDELVRRALGPVAPSVHEDPELVLYGALSGHEASRAALAAVPVRDTEMARRWRRLGRAALDGAPAVELADAATEVLRDAPGSALAMTLAAEAWLRLGEPGRAERLALRAMGREPFWALPRMLRGVARAPLAPDGATDTPAAPAARPCEATGGDAAAWRACAAERLPEDAATWLVLMTALADARAAGDQRAAEGLVAALEAASPQDATLWRIERARLLLTTDTDEAAAGAALRLREVLTVLPEHAQARFLLALARARLRDFVGARTDLLTAVELAPELWREALAAALRIHRLEPSPDGRALVALSERLIQASPLGGEGQRSVEIDWLRALASSDAAAADRALAKAVYARLVDLAPELDFALNNYAWLLHQSGEAPELALNLAERAVALRPEEPAYADTLAVIRDRQAAAAARAAATRDRIESDLEARRMRLERSERRGREASSIDVGN